MSTGPPSLKPNRISACCGRRTAGRTSRLPLFAARDAIGLRGFSPCWTGHPDVGGRDISPERSRFGR